MNKQTERPLSGYRVVDFGQYIAGPAVAMMLADQGAEVIHIDPPSGPRWNNPADAVLNRGKQRLTLDLKTAVGLRCAQQLISNADVVIENFRPGVMKSLGLCAAQCRADNPELIYLSLPGFAEKDRQMAGIPAWEGVIAAAVGQYTDMGLNRILMGINPSFSPLPLASAYAAVLGATAVTLALFARHNNGCGETIEVPISAALMEGLAYNSMHIHGLPNRYKSPRELEIERRKREGQALDMNYQGLQEFLDPFYRTYQCADDRPFYTVCSSHTRHPQACLEVLGIWDEIKALGIPTHSAYLDKEKWPNGAQCTLFSYPLSPPWAALVSAKMKEVFITKSAYQWQEIFGAAGVPGCAHQRTREWINSEHALACGSIIEVEEPEYGTMRQLGNICWLAGDNAVLEKQPALKISLEGPELAALISRWQSQARIGINAEKHAPSALLEGITILDLTNVIAGPTIASTLSRFGAEVICVSPPVPTLDPWNSTVFGMQANQGKKSLLLDLKSPQGREAIKRLLPQVDVVTNNASDAQLQRLGLSLPELKVINPNIILCQFDAYGGPKIGPRSNHLGYDDLVQATTGIMSRFGGSMDTPEEHAHFGTIDVLGGYCAAQAIAVALVNRAKGNGGSLARSSLIAAGQLIQAPFMYDYPTRAAFNEPSGRHIKGAHALYRCYRAADGWFFLALELPRQLNIFCATIAPGFDMKDNTAAETTLEQLFQTEPLSHWQTLCRHIDIACQPLTTMGELREENLMDSRGPVDLAGASSVAFIHYPEHPCGYPVDLIAPNSMRLQQASVTLPCAMPKYGADTLTLLKHLDFNQTQIDEMLNQGLAATSWSERYLPS